jgi:BH2341 protein
VQKPEEVDNPNSDKGISQQTPRVIPGQDGVVTGGSSTKLGKNMMEDMGLSRGQKWTGYQAQHIIPADMADHPVIQKMGMDLDDASNGKFLPVPDSVDTTSVSPLSRHRGYHSTYNEFVRAQLDNIDVNQSPAMLQKEVKELQRKLGILQDKGLPLYPKFGATAELWERFMKNLD